MKTKRRTDSKMPIAWHEECLRNREENYGRAVAELYRQKEYVEKFGNENDFMRAQIERAKREGKTEYDRDRYGHKRGGTSE